MIVTDFFYLCTAQLLVTLAVLQHCNESSYY